MTAIPDDELIPCALWTPDYLDVENFDGPILSIWTRYLPAGKHRPPSALAKVILNLGPRTACDCGGLYRVWRERRFKADTKAEVKAQVEAWGKLQMREITIALGQLAEFKVRP